MEPWHTYPRTIVLKDGSSVTLRLLEEHDGEALHRFFMRLPDEDRLFLKKDVTDRHLIDHWVSGIDHDHTLVIVAWMEGQIVADASLHVDRTGWQRHMGEIRCVVAREYQHRGLGTKLVHELVGHALQRGLRKIKGLVMESQVGAQRAFEKLRFNVVARLPGHVVDTEGKEQTLLVLTTDTAEVWKLLEDLMIDLDIRGGVA
jgi:ribosomal protein S18 acetylase RimI-like enzyme